MAVNAVLAQWMPTIVMVMAIWFGLLYNNKRLDDVNKRLDDFKDLLRAEIRASKERVLRALEQTRAELRAELHAEISGVRAEISELRAEICEIRADIRNLDKRIERLESPLLRPSA